MAEVGKPTETTPGVTSPVASKPTQPEPMPIGPAPIAQQPAVGGKKPVAEKDEAADQQQQPNPHLGEKKKKEPEKKKEEQKDPLMQLMEQLEKFISKTRNDFKEIGGAVADVANEKIAQRQKSDRHQTNGPGKKQEAGDQKQPELSSMTSDSKPNLDTKQLEEAIEETNEKEEGLDKMPSPDNDDEKGMTMK